jgi:hypothetical protein
MYYQNAKAIATLGLVSEAAQWEVPELEPLVEFRVDIPTCIVAPLLGRPASRQLPKSVRERGPQFDPCAIARRR